MEDDGGGAEITCSTRYTYIRFIEYNMYIHLFYVQSIPTYDGVI